MEPGEHPAPSYRLHSRRHVELAAFLGTPIAGALLLRKNFRALGNARGGRWALGIATVTTVSAVLAGAVARTIGGADHVAIAVALEVAFVSSMYLAFNRWMSESVNAHVAAGGRIGPWWHVLTAAVGGFLILFPFALVFAFTALALDWPGINPAESEIRHKGGTRLIFAVDERARPGRPVTRESLEATARALRQRLQKATDRPVLARVLGGGEIVVEMPTRTAAALASLEEKKGADHPVVRAVIARHTLDLRIVDDSDATVARLRHLPAGIFLYWERYEGPGGKDVAAPYLRSKDLARLTSLLQGNAPRGREFHFGNAESIEGEQYYRSYLLEDGGVSGDDIADASVRIEEDPNTSEKRPYVHVVFNAKGAHSLADVTRANVKRRMAIVLDDVVDSAPIIQTAIDGGVCAIHLGSNKPMAEVAAEAKNLALLLRVGNLPLPLRFVAEERIEPRQARASYGSRR
jgi:hypothetical protein